MDSCLFVVCIYINAVGDMTYNKKLKKKVNDLHASIPLLRCTCLHMHVLLHVHSFALLPSSGSRTSLSKGKP